MKFRHRLVCMSAVTVILLGCAGGRQMTPPGEPVVQPLWFDADSARTLIRRGLTAEARSLISPDSTAPADTAALVLWARSYENEERFRSAAAAWQRLVNRFPDEPAYRLNYWQALTALSDREPDRADSIHTIIGREGDIFAAGDAYDELRLAYWAAALTGDSLTGPRAERLTTAFPDSQLSTEIVGERFWDGLYPIWRENQPRIEYLTDFIARHRDSSWRNTAWRMLVGIHAGLGDTAAMQSEAERWVESAPQDPSVLYSAATFLFEHGGNPDTAQVWAQRAYDLRDRLTRPPHTPPEEWQLYGPQIRAGIPTLLARVRLRDGDLENAHKLAVEALSLADYGIDEYATPAPQYYILGEVYSAGKNFDAAANAWIETLTAGDVVNRWAGFADSALKTLYGFKNELELLNFCRRSKNYDGIRFTRVTDSVGLGDARGSRVAWGDYDGDGDDDLLCNGRTLFRNDHNDSTLTAPPPSSGGQPPGNSPPVTGGQPSGNSPPVTGGELKGGQRIFRDVTQAVGIGAEGLRGGIWGDYDNDGDLDLFCFSSSGDTSKAERLFRNRLTDIPPPVSGGQPAANSPPVSGGQPAANSPPVSGGQPAANSPPVSGGESKGGRPEFEDVTAISGAIRDTFSTEAAVWGDFNGDGLLDLFVPGYEKPHGSADELGNGWPDRLLIQDADGVFHDSTAAYGMLPPGGVNLCGRSPAACDFDRDGDLDLYVGNYRLQENLFWVNHINRWASPDSSTQVTPAEAFANLAPWYMLDGEETDGWFGHTIGAEWGDFDGDGDFDLITCNLAHPRYIPFSNRTMLYRNDGPDKPFAEVRREWGIKYDECHSEPVWGDFDNDGDLDLYITCVYPNRRSYLYRNDGDRFTDVTFLSGTRVFNGWGCATADYDNDGDLDIAVCAGGKVELFRNDTQGGNWLEVAVLGTAGTKSNPIGTLVEAQVNGKTFVRQVEGGKGAGSQSSQVLHFGLGNDSEAYVIICSGLKQMIARPYKAGRKVTFDLNQPDVMLRVR